MNPVYDPIVLLLELPYRRWRIVDKNDLLRQGKPTPSLTCLSADKNGSKIFCRSFNSNVYTKHPWVCGSFYLQKLFCWPCILLSQSNSVWITLGYADFKNLSRSILRHEASKDHIHNYLNLKNLEKNTSSVIDIIGEHGKLFKLRYNENVRLNRLCMEHIIDLVLFLAKQELAFRGHDESSNSINKGNFRELVELHFSRCSLEVKNHYKSLQNKFTGTSKIIQNEIISCISEYLTDHIKHEIKQSMFYSVQIDDTTDLTQKTQCSVILRYITNKFELVERFFGFYDVSEDHTAEGLFNLITSLLLEFNIEKKLVGQCYDGASVMAGNLNGLQARIKEIAPNALFTHCFAHKLNLVLQHGCNSNKTCRIFFANITGISAFFHNSTSRTNVVDSIIGKRIPQFVQTRWASRSKIIHLLVKEWISFKEVFEAIINDPKSSSDSICGSVGHLKNLQSFEYAFLGHIFSDIFLITDNLFNTLQNKSFDIEYCLRKISIVCDLIKNKRNETEFSKIYNNAVTLTKLPKPSRNNTNMESSYRILFYEIIDNILMQLSVRFKDTDRLIFLQLADVTKFKDYCSIFPTCALNNLIKTYSNIFHNVDKLKVELEVLYNNVNYHNLPHIYDMIKIFEKDGLKEVMPEVYKLFSLILTIPSTSVSVERSFSCLKRIKTYLRNSTSQQRLSSLSTISIEKLLIQQLKENEPFYEDIINIYASKKDRTIELIYKV